MTAPAASRYRGLRLTITQAPGSDKVWLTIAAKTWQGRWDEWSLIVPAMPVEVDTTLKTSVSDLLNHAISVVVDRLEEG